MKVVGKVVPETDVSLLGLSLQVALTTDSLRNVTGPEYGSGVESRRRMGSDLNESLFTEANVAETTASGSQTPSDVRRPKGSIATSRRGRSKSPHGRTRHELSPKSQTAELRARMARVWQMKLTHYLPSAPPLPPPPIFTAPHDTVTHTEADAAMGILQQQIGDATQCTDVLLQAIAETHQKAQEAGWIAVSGVAGVAQTNAGLEMMVAKLRQELHQMKAKIGGAEERANTTQCITDSAE